MSHGWGDGNKNGELLIETRGNNGLMIGGTKKVTWVSPDPHGGTQNQIDHICISKNWRKSLLDVCNKRGADVGSDHHLIMGIMRIYIVTYSGSIHDGTSLHSKSQYTTVKHSQQLFEHTYTSNPHGLGTLTPILAVRKLPNTRRDNPSSGYRSTCTPQQHLGV
jgi:hypothetical protein